MCSAFVLFNSEPRRSKNTLNYDLQLKTAHISHFPTPSAEVNESMED